MVGWSGGPSTLAPLTLSSFDLPVLPDLRLAEILRAAQHDQFSAGVWLVPRIAMALECFGKLRALTRSV